MEHIRDAWSVGHEPAGLDLLAIAEQCRQPGAERRCNDARAVGTNESTDHDVTCVRLRLDRCDGGNQFLRSPDFGWHYFNTERACCSLSLAHLQYRVGIANINHDCQSAEPRDDLTQEFESLAAKIGRLERQAGHVAARL